MLNFKLQLHQIVNINIMQQLKKSPNVYFFQILSPTMLQEMNRFLESYNLDDLIKIVWLKSTDPTLLSKGTDFKYILHQVKEKQDQEAITYLSQIQNTAAYIAGYQKPLLTILDGDITGSAAAMFVNTPFALSSPNVSLRISESLSGFALTGGASYTLSRLPSEVGVYLALTGTKLNSQQLKELKLVYGQLEDLEQAHYTIDELTFQQQQYASTEEYYGHQGNRQQQARMAGQEQYYEKVEEEIKNRIFNQTPELQEDAKLTMIEILYKNELMKYHNRQYKFKQQIANYSVQFEDLVLDHLIDNSIITQNKQKLPYEQISRCFSANSLFEIEQRLKEEQSEWAENCLKAIQFRSPLCNELSLQLIRKAEKSNFVDCLENEFKVAVKLIKEQDLESGVESNIRKTKPASEWKHKSSKDISKNEIESFFDSSASLNLIRNQFLPSKVSDLNYIENQVYYKNYPDNIRYFLNEQSLNVGLKGRSDQEVDVYAFLTNYNYPVDDATLKTETIRNVFMNSEEKQRKFAQKLSKFKDLCSYPKSLRQYYQKRQNYLLDQFKNKELIEKKIKESIENHFQSQFNKRMNSIRNVAEIAQFKQKMDLFSSVRNAIVNSRLTAEEDKSIDPAKWAALKYGLYFTDKNDQSFLSTYHKAVDDPTLFSQIWKNKPEKNDYFEKEYRVRYGDPLEAMNLAPYNQKLLKIGSQWETISKYIEKNGDKKSLELIAKNRIQTEDEIQSNIEEIYQHQKEEIKTYTDQLVQNKLDTLKKLKTEMVIQFYLAKYIFFSKKSLSFSEQLKELTNLKEVKSNLQSFINQDSHLKGLLSPLFDSVHPFCKDTQKNYRNMLQLIYNAKVKQFVHGPKSLPGQKKVVRQQFETFLFLKNSIDQILANEVDRDLNKLVESHVFFTFSYLLIRELEKFYQALSNIPKSGDAMVHLKNKFGIQITQKEQFDQFLDYLNELVKISAVLYETYRENLYFTSDQNLYAYIRLRQFKRASKNVFEDHIFATQSIISKVENRKKIALQEVEVGQVVDEISYDEIYNELEQPWIPEMKVYDKENSETKEDFYYNKGFFEAGILNKVMRMIKKNQKNRRELLVGIDYYVCYMDRIANQASFTENESIPEEIQQKMSNIDKMEQDLKWLNQEQTLEEWFNLKFTEAIGDVFAIRKQYENRLSPDALNLFDEEISSLFEVDNFQSVFEQSFLEDIRALNQWGRQIQLLNASEQDRQIQRQKMPYKFNDVDEIEGFSLFLTGETSAQDQEATNLKSDILYRESLKAHPLSKKSQLKKKEASYINEDAEHKKITKELNEGADLVAEGMYKSHIIWDDAHDELEKLYKRINFRNEQKMN